MPSTIGPGDGGNQGDEKEQLFDDFDMSDPILDGIKLPQVSFNVQTLIILIKENTLSLNRDAQSPDSKDSQRKARESGDSPSLQRDEGPNQFGVNKKNDAVEVLQSQSIFSQVEISHPTA